MTYHGFIKNGALVLDATPDLPEGTEVEVRILPSTSDEKTGLGQRLMKYAGKVITHKQLLKEVWGPDSVFETHYLRVYMGQLRHKLEADPARPRHIITEPGVGYRLRVEQ